MPRFTIRIPLYNAQDTIATTITSIINQTFIDWELIIVDDASTDGSFDIVRKFAKTDNRIHLYRRTNNSGSAFIPLTEATQKASSNWIIGIGNDDTISHDYLEKINTRIEETNADIILTKMKMVDTNNRLLEELPSKDVITENLLSAKQAVSLTIGWWKLSVNGACINKQLYKRLWKEAPEQGGSMNADELMFRYLLSYADSIAFADCFYYYLFHPSSICRTRSIKHFDKLSTDVSIAKLAYSMFGEHSPENIRAEKELCKSMLYFARSFYDWNDLIVNKYDKHRILKILKQGYSQVKWKYTCDKIPKHRYIIYKSGFLIMMLALSPFFNRAIYKLKQIVRK